MTILQGLPDDAVARIRRPVEVYTDAYLNDPIQFDPQVAFEPETVVPQVSDVVVVDRDLASYMTVDINAKTSAVLPISMTSTVINRADYLRIINRAFQFFPTS